LPSGSDQADGDGQYVSQDQALESEEGDSIDDYNPDNPGDVSSLALVCPKDPTEFVLFLSHTWDFSPNRDLEKMRVDGQTAPFVSCPLTVQGSKVTMKDCFFPITNTGFILTDDGSCDISASGDAILSADEPYCENGKVIITFIESIDPDATTNGAMNCPNKSQPYIPFYPPSITTRTFDIAVGGHTQTEDMNPDLSNQFKYHKEWTLFSKDFPMPERED
ncbi:MAG: hypothetical protein HQ574_00365, partial [Chloroflexi bacterium]|nr:hypothetical protein [Chloroflexota bacterium]